MPDTPFSSNQALSTGRFFFAGAVPPRGTETPDLSAEVRRLRREIEWLRQALRAGLSRPEDRVRGKGA